MAHWRSFLKWLTERKYYLKLDTQRKSFTVTPPGKVQPPLPSTGTNSPLGMTIGDSKGILFSPSNNLGKDVICSVQP